MQRKKFRNHKISELKSGGDKRDRTADLLNAIEPMPRLVEDYFAAERKSVEIQGFFGSFDVGLLE